MEKKENGFAIINKATGQSMCPTDPNQLNDMIYTQNHQIESSFLFQFYTNNGQVISSDLANNLQQQTCFIK